MGYKGVDTTEMIFEGHRISADQVLGGEPGQGFYQMMDGVEVGRVNVGKCIQTGEPGAAAGFPGNACILLADPVSGFDVERS